MRNKIYAGNFILLAALNIFRKQISDDTYHTATTVMLVVTISLLHFVTVDKKQGS